MNPALPSPPPYPRLRDDIDAQPAAAAGPDLFVLYDAAGIIPEQLLLSAAALRVALRLDGTRPALAVHDLLERDLRGTGIPVPGGEDILRVVDALEAAGFLDNERFARLRAAREAEFLAAPAREPRCAGAVYPEDPQALREQLDRWLAEAPPPEEAPAPGAPTNPPAGALLPHIDFARGGGAYGQAYRELARSRPPALVYLVGTAHRPLKRRYAVCAKDFATPLGTVRHDPEAAAALLRAGRAAGFDWTTDITAHLSEHSVELQTVWLRHVWPGAAIVPLLAAPVNDLLAAASDDDGGGALRNDAEIAALAAALRAAAENGDALLMASADLSHAGPRFEDDARAVDARVLGALEAADRRYLERLAAGDPHGAARWLAPGAAAAASPDGTDRPPPPRVCGTAAIHAVALALAGRRGRLLGYHQAASADGAQAVTFASLFWP